MLPNHAIDPARGAVAAIVFGLASMAFGLAPGSSVRMMVVRLKDEMRRFSDPLSQSLATPSHHDAHNEERLPEQTWFAIGGLALVALGVIALISN